MSLTETWLHRELNSISTVCLKLERHYQSINSSSTREISSPLLFLFIEMFRACQAALSLVVVILVMWMLVTTHPVIADGGFDDWTGMADTDDSDLFSLLLTSLVVSSLFFSSLFSSILYSPHISSPLLVSSHLISSLSWLSNCVHRLQS